ncbi:hypothetical protein HPB50_009552 [Hyalomma asiaticum]|uniref:Uncharacterized protein n=1 Tax=Hyalomma asiaticum TaxID=266040 RepID=A0ACB7TH62_HYAAI|nr:hypothetical protein HPB50_009552 [Hyalomma asiaticum]
MICLGCASPALIGYARFFLFVAALCYIVTVLLCIIYVLGVNTALSALPWLLGKASRNTCRVRPSVTVMAATCDSVPAPFRIGCCTRTGVGAVQPSPRQSRIAGRSALESDKAAPPLTWSDYAELAYTVTAVVLYIIASVTQLVSQSSYYETWPTMFSALNGQYIAAGVFGLLQAIVYGAGAFLLFQDWKATRPPPPPPQPPRPTN